MTIPDSVCKRIIRFVIHTDCSSRDAAKEFHTSHTTILNILHKCRKYYPKSVKVVENLLERHKDVYYKFFRNK